MPHWRVNFYAEHDGPDDDVRTMRIDGDLFSKEQVEQHMKNVYPTLKVKDVLSGYGEDAE